MTEEQNVQQEIKEKKYIRLKPITFILILLVTILVTSFSVNLIQNNKAADSFITQDKESNQEQNNLTAMPDLGKEFTKLLDTYNLLTANYFQEVDSVELINGAINGMVDSIGDPYTDYMTVEESTSFNSTIDASFQGIGAEITSRNEQITVVSPIKGSPAEKAGIRANDIILTVDGTSISGMSTNEAVLLIRGPKGTTVTLTISRPGVSDIISIPIVRDNIPIETVYGEMITDTIAKVQITSFSKTTFDDLKEKLEELSKLGMESIILDLRQNPGGLLNSAIEIASLFLKENTPVLLVEGRDGKRIEYGTYGGNLDLPLVVLINDGSASASEILAAALNENSEVPLVGKTTFGKGTVQTLAQFNDGSEIKYTIQKWLTPKGNWINEVGIKPDYEVELPSYAFLTVIPTNEVLKVNSFGNYVSTAQQMLLALGYEVRTDGLFDKKMEEQVKSFQKANGLTSDGILTGTTSSILMDQIRELINKNDTQLIKAIELLESTN